MQITPAEVAETLAMVSKQNLDIRTITLGINLRGCVDADVDALAAKVYDRMTAAAERLVPTAEQLEREFGIPIVNKRISVTPHRGDLRRRDRRRPHTVAVAMDRAGKEVGVDFVGGFSALVHKGATRRSQAHGLHPYGAGRHRPRLRLSVNVGSTRPASTWTPPLRWPASSSAPPNSPPISSASAPANSSCSATLWRTTPSWPAPSMAPARPTK